MISNQEFKNMIDIGIDHIYEMAEEGKTVEDLAKLIKGQNE